MKPAAQKIKVYYLLPLLLFAICGFSQTSEKDSHVDIVVRGDYRYITANGIPNHRHGDFPNRGNPNTIRAQSYTFRVPANPRLANELTPLGMNPFGIAINGVPFDPGAAEWWNNDPASGWQYEALSGKINLGMDQNNAHVQPNGAYHYHGLPTGLIERLGDGQRMVLIGYAADGFPIYERYGYARKDIRTDIKQLRSSYRLKTGTRANGPGGKYDGSFVQDYEYVAGAGDLDQCNGREGVTPEYLSGTYYYVITSEFPFIPRCFRGTPDDSFRRRGPAGPRGRPPVGRPPRN
ncbi:MAG TPA: YHYH protein [Pyrinomonadaceae bacterium]|nr:YHYH protein [Pyrinomonadaceae bacterium]